VPNGYEAGWSPEPISVLQRRENVLHLPGIEPKLVGRPALSLVAVRSELSRLLVPRDPTLILPTPYPERS
jgi:hypothetical protein